MFTAKSNEIQASVWSLNSDHLGKQNTIEFGGFGTVKVNTEIEWYSFVAVYSAVLAAIIVVALTGMFRQVKDLILLWQVSTYDFVSSSCLDWSFQFRRQFHRALKQRILLSNIKQTTSQNAYILYESLAGNQRYLLSKYFW